MIFTLDLSMLIMKPMMYKVQMTLWGLYVLHRHVCDDVIIGVEECVDEIITSYMPTV